MGGVLGDRLTYMLYCITAGRIKQLYIPVEGTGVAASASSEAKLHAAGCKYTVLATEL
jgi:hypothetical protein